MRVLVTRVQPQAARWVQLLSDQYEAVALPLLETRALADTAALQAAGQRWSDYAAVMFVSSQAVSFFFASNQALAQVYQEQTALDTRAWATGPGTRTALLAQGVPAHQVDAPPMDSGQFDSEALWQQVCGQIAPGARVLVVRGDVQGDGSEVDKPDEGATKPQNTPGVGRDWLAQRLQQAGARVDFVVAYQRCAPVWGDAERVLATQAATDGSVWLFSSAEAVGHLRNLLPGQSWAQARAVATHPRIEQAALGLGFAQVRESRPTLDAVRSSIESFL
ncbi:uroporphyrinogen-III synthase [Rhodoferax sp.]|uniref:uroporphyrinogen-III synthase n=1 Tax=Rhodoferax sp. TaxID=50421 RepID=UPI002840BE99|nr:uroporphyrinogen-III synthase [Rhodoferax sp.]MDR3371148.1 uroporphyrinogen-III synthase [Rhodoferax sp.]